MWYITHTYIHTYTHKHTYSYLIFSLEETLGEMTFTQSCRLKHSKGHYVAITLVSPQVVL